MSEEADKLPSDWERHKFEVETRLKERELHLAAERLKVESRRNILISAVVPLVIALVTAVPGWIASRSQKALQKAEFEARLVTESVSTGNPDQAATNLQFLISSGLLGGETAARVNDYLQNRVPGTGRALPTR